ncbi:uncharacterized protein [Argopecten irradians]|uniref:uncharacterized protein n=1 Tax=Argopecten irradians TaxID=31199 RepID=UPI00371083B3
MDNRPINYDITDRPVTRSQGLHDLSSLQDEQQPDAIIEVQQVEDTAPINTGMASANIPLKKYNGEESPHLWLSSMDAWQKMHGYDNTKMHGALPLLLEGPAALWLETVSDITSLTDFKSAFIERFGRKPTDMSFMQLKQDISESPLLFIQRAEKNGLGTRVDEVIKVQAALQGLLPQIQSSCIGREPKTFAELRKAVELAMAQQSCQQKQTDTASVHVIQDMCEAFKHMASEFKNTINQQSLQICSIMDRQQQEASSFPQGRWNKPQNRPRHHQQQQFPRQHHHQRSDHTNYQKPRYQDDQQQQTYRCNGCGLNGTNLIWYFAVMMLFFSCVQSETQTPIQRLNYGILFEPTAKVYLGQEYWSHTFKMPMPKRMYLPEIPPCRRQTCKMADTVIKSLNNLRMQCMSSINATVMQIHHLVPHSYFQNTLALSSRRSKCGLFDFIGQISKSLFGTATSNDVENLKRHMQVLNNNNVKLAKAMAQEAHQLTSFMSTVNDRLDNVVKAVQINHDQTITLSNQFAASLDGIEHEFVLLENMMLSQINVTTVLNKHLEHAQLAIHDLVKGKLSPFLFSPHDLKSALKQVQSIMTRKIPGFRIIHNDPIHYYSYGNFVFSRHDSFLYVMLKIPISSFTHPLPLYKVYSVPVSINSTSTHATQLLDTPDYFLHTSDNQHFAYMSADQLQNCFGSDIIYCPFHIALSSVAKHTCLSSIFYNQKEIVKDTCDFRFIQNTLSPSIRELAPSTLLMYKISMLALDCPTGQKIIKGCDFCVVNVPCRCTVTSDFYLYQQE